MKNKVMRKQYHDLKKLENMIKYQKMYNIRNKVVKFLLNTGIGIDYALPFIIAIIMVSQFSTFSENKPFVIDELPRKANVETIDTSSGIHLENITFNHKQNEKSLSYSTAWVMNDLGLYERVLTTYKLNNVIDFENPEAIFKMNKEELDKILKIANVETIYKEKLDPEDELYFKDTLIIVNYEEDDNIIYKSETQKENIINSLLFIVISLMWGNCFRNLEKITVKTYIRDILEIHKLNILDINDKNIETIKGIIEQRKENIELLENSNEEGIKLILRK